MRVESLSYFLEIAHSRSFTIAARRLYMSQQGLSKSIQSLEEELGVALFEREGKKVRLTAAGRDLVPLASRCMNDYEAIKGSMAQHAHNENNLNAQKIELILMPFIANGIFTLLRNELDTRGLSKVVPIEKDLPDIMRPRSATLASKCALIAIPLSMIPCLLLNPDISFDPLIESDIVLMGSEVLISPRKRSFSLEEIAELPVAQYNEPIINTIIQTMFADCPLEKVVFHSSNSTLMKEFIQSGTAVGFTDSFSSYLRPGSSNIFYTPIENTLSFVIGFYYSNKQKPSKQHLKYMKAFRQLIEETCKPYLAKHPTPYIERIF